MAQLLLSQPPVKPLPEAHMDMILFWRASTWFHNRYYNGTIHIIDNIIVLSDLVESSGYSSKTLQKGSCPHASYTEEHICFSFYARIWYDKKKLQIFISCLPNAIHNIIFTRGIPMQSRDTAFKPHTYTLHCNIEHSSYQGEVKKMRKHTIFQGLYQRLSFVNLKCILTPNLFWYYVKETYFSNPFHQHSEKKI